MDDHPGPLGAIARHWFEVIRACGSDVREVLHDGQPTACVDGVALAYVNVFRAHVNVGFFGGAEIADPTGLLSGTGRFMRHVRVTASADGDDAALHQVDSDFDIAVRGLGVRAQLVTGIYQGMGDVARQSGQIDIQAGPQQVAASVRPQIYFGIDTAIERQSYASLFSRQPDCTHEAG